MRVSGTEQGAFISESQGTQQECPLSAAGEGLGLKKGECVFWGEWLSAVTTVAISKDNCLAFFSPSMHLKVSLALIDGNSEMTELPR